MIFIACGSASFFFWTERYKMFFEFNVPVILSYHSCEYEDYFLVYYPDQQMHNMHINNILCIVNTPTSRSTNPLHIYKYINNIL